MYGWGALIAIVDLVLELLLWASGVACSLGLLLHALRQTQEARRADWPAGAVLVAAYAGFTLSAWVGFVLIILAHELGHAALVRHHRFRVASILLHGAGGECAYRGDPTAPQVSVIAWGGVLGQAMLFVLVFTPVHSGAVPPALVRSGFVTVTVGYNLFTAAYNLLPLRGFDGEHAWKLFRFVPTRTAARTESAEQLAARLVSQATQEVKRPPPRSGGPAELQCHSDASICS